MPSFVAEFGNQSSATSSNTINAARDAAVLDTDLLLAWWCTTNGGLGTTPAGWTRLAFEQIGTYLQFYWYWRRADALTTYPWTATAGQAVKILAYSSAADPVAGEWGYASGLTASCAVGQANSLAVSFHTAASTAATTPTGTDTARGALRTATYSTIRNVLLGQDSGAAAVPTGTVSRTFTSASSLNSRVSAIIALRHAAAASGPEPGRRLLLAA